MEKVASSMSPRLICDRAHFKSVTAVAAVLALAGGAAEIPLGPVGSVAHAQIAPTQQPGISFGSVNNLNGDWEASVFFESGMTVRTVSIGFVPADSTNPKEEAPADDPVFTRIPEVAEYRVDHMKRTQVLASYDVTARRTQSSSTSGHPSIRITYELPGVQVGQGERLALFAPGRGGQYPTPLRGGGARFTRPSVNADIRGAVTLHEATAAEYKQTMVEIRQGAETFTSPVQPDGSYEIAVPSPSGTMTINVVPPAGFATPEPKTWEAAEGLAGPDFDVYPITVSGTLLDASGTPVQGAPVTIAGRHATTDQDGNFTVAKVPAGTHDVVFGETTTTHGKEVSGVVVSDQRDNWIGEQRVNEKPQLGTVSGRVTGPGNQGVANVTVQAGGESVTTTANGDYVITGVPAGLTTIKVTAAPAKYVLPAPEQVTLTGRGAETVNFKLTLKPTPKPSTTPLKPRPTTSKPSPSSTTPKPTTAKPTTPKPTPKPTTTPKPAPTVGSVAGKVTDPAGTAVPGRGSYFAKGDSNYITPVDIEVSPAALVDEPVVPLHITVSNSESARVFDDTFNVSALEYTPAEMDKVLKEVLASDADEDLKEYARHRLKAAASETPTATAKPVQVPGKAEPSPSEKPSGSSDSPLGIIIGVLLGLIGLGAAGFGWAHSQGLI